MQFFQDEHFSWKVLAVESVVIMLSVVLGFWLNGWREAQGEQETVEAALQSIAAEVRENQREIGPLIPHYRAMSDTLKHLASVRGKRTAIEMEKVPSFRGLPIPLLRASAFEAARSTEALSHMEFELADALSSTYRTQQFYTDLIEEITTGLVMGTFETVGDWQTVYTLLANNGVFASTSYPELLQLLSEEYGVTATEAESAASTRTAP